MQLNPQNCVLLYKGIKTGKGENIMNAPNYSSIINWIKTHRFWTSVMVLGGLHLLIATMPLNLLGMGGVLEYALSSQFLGYYTLIGGIIWSFQQGKTGCSLITLGIVSLLFALNILVKFYVYNAAGMYPVYSLSNYIMLSAVLSSGAFFLYFGTLRYRKWAYLRNESKES